MTAVLTALSVACLAGFPWVVFHQLPRARREQDAFALLCSLLTALMALFGWLFFAVGVRSR